MAVEGVEGVELVEHVGADEEVGDSAILSETKLHYLRQIYFK